MSLVAGAAVLGVAGIGAWSLDAIPRSDTGLAPVAQGAVYPTPVSPAVTAPANAAGSSTFVRERPRQQLSRSASRREQVGGDDVNLGSLITARRSAIATIQDQAQRHSQRHDQQWSVPVSAYAVTATFGQSSALWSTVHTGIDLANVTGTPVTSVANGVVVSASYDGSYGNKIVVRHEDGTETWYAHLNTIDVTVGQQVASGQLLGTIGSTGNVTGPHLHLEVRPGGLDPVDPRAAFAARGISL